jgi:hypothetical protein
VPVHQHPAPSQVQYPSFFNQSSTIHQHGVNRSLFSPFPG